MQLWRDQIRQHPYPRDLDHIAQEEFGLQLDEVSCGVAAVHHGLLLGGLAIPKAALQAIFRTHPDPGPNAYGYVDEERLEAGLQDLGFKPEWVEFKSRESTRQFLERLGQFLARLGQEMEGGAFVIACIYLWEGSDGEESHWITVGRWKDGRLRVVDSAWDPLMYSLTPTAFHECAWGNSELGHSVLLVRPGIWQKNYEEWLPGRDRLLRLEGHPLEASETMAERLRHAARVLNDGRYTYKRLEFCVSEKSSMSVKMRDRRRQAIAVSTPTADEREGQVVVVRRLAHSDRDQPGPPELVFRMSELRGWQLG